MKSLIRALLVLAWMSFVTASLLADPLALAVVGRYAYVGGPDGLTVIDVSNPETPKKVSFCKLPGRASDIALSSRLGYISVQEVNDQGVVISSRALPRRLAYIAAQESGLRIVDISDPTAPTEVGSYRPRPAVRPAVKKKDQWGPVVESVALAGKHAYVTCNYVPNGKDKWYGIVHVLDISNPKAPAEVGTFETPGLFLDVAVAGKYAYVANKTGTLHVLDVSDPRNPAEVGACHPLGEPHGVLVVGNYAYVSDDDGAMHIADISNPKAPKALGSFLEETRDKPAVGEAVAVAGKYAYVASDHNALYVVDISDPKAPKEVALLKMKGPALAVVAAGDYVYVNIFRGDLFIMKLKEKQRE
jgi:hypothetical protein